LPDLPELFLLFVLSKVTGPHADFCGRFTSRKIGLQPDVLALDGQKDISLVNFFGSMRLAKLRKPGASFFHRG